MWKVNLKILTAVFVSIITLTLSAAGRIIYVDPNGSTDFTSIQAAIDDANNSDEIEVAPGVYYESINFKGKGVRLYSSGGPKVTIIDANGIAGVYHVVQCVSGERSGTSLIGFTITGGNANGTDSNSYGGGMYNYGSDPTVTNCIFRGNSAKRGGGMCNEGSNPTVTNCIFMGNTARIYGGGGMYNYYSGAKLTNCTFSGNHSTTSGGGMENYESAGRDIVVIVNCILWGDTPDEIFNSFSTYLNVAYSDVQGGTGESWFGSDCIDVDPCFVNTKHINPNLWNLRLKADSPCIDAGYTLWVDLPLDIDGKPRVIDNPQTPNTYPNYMASLNVVDMGAYEFEPCRISSDINCDGVVDFKDVAILCKNWLAGFE